jgi:uncharacterized protein YyaL (SSP411 family)
VQSTAGSGGWPLNVFLTPDLKPFFGGTYFPPQSRYGRPSFLELLQQIAELWRERKLEIAASADELHARLELITARDAKEDAPLTPAVLHLALETFKDAYDPVNGGFGGAPKFPQPGIPLFVLRAAKRFDDPKAVEMVLHTCEKMAAGGINDQLAGGFARYSVDAEWLVPHFEKMLYDNAQLVHLYLDAHLMWTERNGKTETSQSSTQSPFAATARNILDYVLHDMTHPAGGFYSAEDADSEGHEGKFYCWTRQELSELLSPEEFRVASGYFGITSEGNFVDHSHPHPLPGQNVVSIVQPRLPAADEPLLESAKARMLAARAKRVRPHLDDKVLASWNGLMLGAFARASAVLNDATYRAAAEKNLAFLKHHLWVDPSTVTKDSDRGDGHQNGRLFHRWRDGARDDVQLLEGYAFLLDGVIHLYEATLEPAHLEFACALARSMIETFHDPANGGFWQSPVNTGDLILRVKDDYDGAEPSGNSVATFALLKLAHLTDQNDFKQAAEATLQLSAARLQKQPAAIAFMLQALDFWLDEPRRVVIAGESKSESSRSLLHAAHAVYQPNKVVLGNVGPVEAFAKTLLPKGGATAYVCSGTSCQPPTNDPAKVQELLR